MSDTIKNTKAHDASADAKTFVDPSAIQDDVPVYRVKELSFLNDRLYKEGELVVFRGDPGDNLEPANALAEEAKAAHDAAEAKRAAESATAAKPAPAVGSEEFAKLLSAEVAKAVAAVLAEKESAAADKVAKAGKKDGDKPLV